MANIAESLAARENGTSPITSTDAPRSSHIASLSNIRDSVRAYLTRLTGIRHPVPEAPTTIQSETNTSSETREAAVLDSVRYLRNTNTPFIVSADVDKNLATYAPVQGEIPGLDPRGVVIDENARDALRQMHEAGIPIVISTSRGAAEVSQYLQIPGITIIGSQGLEVRRVDSTDWRNGESKIDPRFAPYKDQMNAMMRDVYTRFVASVTGSEVNPDDIKLPTEPVFEIPTPEGGRIVVQLKGQSEEYPMGIAMALNVNQPISGTPDDYVARQGEIADIQRRYLESFRQVFATAWAKNFPDTTQESLAGIMSVRTRNESILYNGVRIPTLDLEVRPGMESGKGYAQMQLMMADDDPRRAENFKGAPSAPFTYFSGDSVDPRQPNLTKINPKYYDMDKNKTWGAGQDWTPMHVGHLVFALSRGRGGVVGIQTLRPGETAKDIPNVDTVVDGPAGLGNLLMKMAQVIRESGQAA